MVLVLDNSLTAHPNVQSLTGVFTANTEKIYNLYKLHESIQTEKNILD